MRRVSLIDYVSSSLLQKAEYDISSGEMWAIK